MALGRELEDFFRSAMSAYSWAQEADIREANAQEAQDRSAMRQLMRAGMSPQGEQERPGLLRRLWDGLVGGGTQTPQAPQSAIAPPPDQATQQAPQQVPQQVPQQAISGPMPAQTAGEPQREVLSPPDILGIQVATNPGYRPGQPIGPQQHLGAVERIWNAAQQMGRPDLGMRAITAYWSGLQQATSTSLALGIQAMRNGDLNLAQRVLQQAYNLYYPGGEAVRITVNGNRLVAQQQGRDGRPIGEPTELTERQLHDTLLMVANPMEFARLTLSREQLEENAAYRRELINLRQQQARDAAEDRRLRYSALAQERADARAAAVFNRRLDAFSRSITDVSKTLLENEQAKTSLVSRLAGENRDLAARLAGSRALDDALYRAMDAARIAGEGLIGMGAMPNARQLVTAFTNGIVFDGNNFSLPVAAVPVGQDKYRLSVGGREVGVMDRDSVEAVFGSLNLRFANGS